MSDDDNLSDNEYECDKCYHLKNNTFCLNELEELYWSHEININIWKKFIKEINEQIMNQNKFILLYECNYDKNNDNIEIHFYHTKKHIHHFILIMKI